MNSLERIVQNFEHVFLDANSVNSQVGQRALDIFPSHKISIIEGRPNVAASGSFTGDEYARSKKLLHITEHPGLFFKRCPGAKKGLACCNYFVLNLGLQCDMDCSYCYLQSFINTPYTVIYSNIDQALTELEGIYKDLGASAVRIGTGEVIDSLSLDPLTLYSRTLMEFFKDKPSWRLEFKTKSDNVDQFIDASHAGNVIVSWSINPQYIVGKEEHRTASLNARLDAAKRCLDKGFQIAFHIDPVIWHDEWTLNYTLLIDEITKRFGPLDMPYISLGSLRFKAEQKDMMRERFGMDSLVTRAEMFAGAAGKMRYDQALREEMFQFIIQEFKKRDPLWKIFLCMETPETWVNATGDLPVKKDDLRSLFRPIAAK